MHQSSGENYCIYATLALVTLYWWRCCRQATSWVHYTTSCNTHSLVLLKMGGINARYMLS